MLFDPDEEELIEADNEILAGENYGKPASRGGHTFTFTGNYIILFGG